MHRLVGVQESEQPHVLVYGLVVISFSVRPCSWVDVALVPDGSQPNAEDSSAAAESSAKPGRPPAPLGSRLVIGLCDLCSRRRGACRGVQVLVLERHAARLAQEDARGEVLLQPAVPEPHDRLGAPHLAAHQPEGHEELQCAVEGGNPWKIGIQNSYMLRP